MNPHVEALAAKVGGVVLDVDGVLTNGQIVYSDRGDELKFFHVGWCQYKTAHAQRY